MRPSTMITSERFDRRLSQVACFGGAPVIFGCAVLGLARMGAAPVELLTGLLAAAAVSISMVVLGLVASPKVPAV